MTTEKSSLEHALQKAATSGATGRVRRITPTAWRVTGSRGDRYVVTRRDEGWGCTCPAGEHGNGCYHLAAVWLAHIPDAEAREVVLGLLAVQPIAIKEIKLRKGRAA